MAEVRVELERSGGFGGLRPAATVLDSRQLDPDAARELVELVDAAEPALAAAVPLTGSGVPDGIRYRLTIVRDGRVRSTVCDDRGLPPQARPLVERVAAEGRPRP